MINKRLPRVFKARIMHSVELENGKEVYTFLADTQINENSITELEEKIIVKWLVNNPGNREFLLEEFIIPNYSSYFLNVEVEEPVLNRNDRKKIGDIDFLICPTIRPDLATVVEFKRIKFLTKSNGDVKINGINKIRKKGIRQVNELLKLGFYKVYLGIIIEDDGRFVNNKGTIFKSAGIEDLDKVFMLTFDERIAERIGVFYIIVNQPTGEHYDFRNNLKLTIHKQAIGERQNDEITNRIKLLQKEK